MFNFCFFVTYLFIENISAHTDKIPILNQHLVDYGEFDSLFVSNVA